MIGGDKMSICKNCGAEVNEEAKFCANCGATVEAASEEIETSNNKKISSFKISKNSIIAVVVVLAIVLGAIIPVRNFIIRRDPIKRTFYGTSKLYKANAVHSTSTLKLQLTSVPEDAQMGAIAKLVENFSIKMDSKSNNKDGEASINAQLIFKEQPFIKANMYMNKQGIVISAPDIYNKTLFAKWDELNKLTNGEKQNSQIDIEKYRGLLNLKTSKAYEPVEEEYSKLFKDSFKGSFVTGDKTKLEVIEAGTTKSISTGTVNFTTDSGVVLDFLDKFIEKAATDENVKKLVKDKMMELFTLIEANNDYDKFNITKEEMETVKKDFDKNYDEAMSNLLKDKNFEEAKKALIMNVRSSFRFDSSNNLRGALTEVNASVDQGQNVGFKMVIDQVINSLNSKVTVDKLEFTGTNLTAITPEEQQDMASQLQQNIMNIIGQLGLTSLMMGN